MTLEPAPQASELIARPFGADNRQRMLERYFTNAGPITPENAWEHVYRLLLWIDRTTGLAHCYESDKAQPGRAWYARSLTFHTWVAQALAVSPRDLTGQIDWLFGEATGQLAALTLQQQQQRTALAAGQRERYTGLDLPEPGEDLELEAIIGTQLRGWLREPVPVQTMRALVERMRGRLSLENKRKNLVGEGFEDVLASLVRRLPGAARLSVITRPLLHEITGFRQPPSNEKPRRVDMAIIGPRQQRRLISAKWSIRADREEQFGVDFETYSRLEDAGQDFDFVLVTNEFDAARLVAACRRRRQNAPLFSAVIHVNPEGLIEVHGTEIRRHRHAPATPTTPSGSSGELARQVASGRLSSLAHWLTAVTA